MLYKHCKKISIFLFSSFIYMSLILKYDCLFSTWKIFDFQPCFLQTLQYVSKKWCVLESKNQIPSSVLLSYCPTYSSYMRCMVVDGFRRVKEN